LDGVGAAGDGQLAVAEGLVAGGADGLGVEVGAAGVLEDDGLGTGVAVAVRVAVHDSRQNDPNPVIWQPGQDYRMADALHTARTQPTRTRHGLERVGPER